MPIKVACQCGQRFTAKDSLAGKTINCPKCKSPLRIPRPQTAPVAPQAKAEAPIMASKLDDLLDEAGLKASVGHRCPSCQKELQPGTVLCVNCGYDMRTGTKMQTRRGISAGFADDEDEDFAKLPTHDNEMLDWAEREILRGKKEQQRLQKGAPWWVFLVGLLACAGFVAYAIIEEPDPLVFGFQATSFVLGFVFSSWLYIGGCNMWNGIEGSLWPSPSGGVEVPGLGYAVAILMLVNLIGGAVGGALGFVIGAVMGKSVMATVTIVLLVLPINLFIIALVSALMLRTTIGRGFGVAICYLLFSLIVGFFGFLAYLFVALFL